MIAEIGAGGWGILAAAALLIGFSKTGFPGAGILAIPMAAMVIDARASTGVILPILIVGDIFAVAYYHRHAVWPHLVKLLPCAVVGIIIGFVALHYVTSGDQLKPIMGGIILVMLGLHWWWTRAEGEEVHIPQGWWFPVCIGVLGGITTMMANAAGPIMIIYLLAMRLPKQEFIGTGAWYFLILNCFKVPFSQNLGLINADSLQLNLLLVPLVIAGALLGARVVKHVPEKGFAAVVQLLAVAGAVYLLPLADWCRMAAGLMTR